MACSQDPGGWLRPRLSEKRWLHSLAAERRAAFLAGIHGEDPEKAALAGLLHDCCHCLPKDKQLKILEAGGIMLDAPAMLQPQLWHAPAGSAALRNELHIDDEAILEAVRLHTTGAAGMSRLAQVVYLADLTSDGRDFENAGFYRELSEKDLSLCMFESLRFTIGALAGKGAPIVRDAWEAYNYFLL